jgi:hypothetical protein
MSSVLWYELCPTCSLAAFTELVAAQQQMLQVTVACVAASQQSSQLNIQEFWCRTGSRHMHACC